MFHGMGKLGGKLVFVATDYSFSERRNFGERFFSRTESYFPEKWKVSDENAKFQTFCTQKHLAKSQNLYLPHRFGLAPSHGFALSFPPTHTIFLSHRRKDNVQFFF